MYLGIFSFESMLLLLFFATTTFLFGILIDKSQKTNIKRIVLIIGIAFNLLTLILYKYTNYINIILLKFNIEILKLMIPIGLSFYIFQNISYLVDIYKNKYPVEKNYFNYIIYISFFPRILNGPICRYDTFKKQILNYSKPNVDKIYKAIIRISYGFGKIAIVGATIFGIWNSIYSNFKNFGISSTTALLGILCYSLYIYLNFSGYIDISIGLGNLFNIELPENFNYPYFADSISDFWRKWHISLSSFFRDYVYIPLGGNRKGNVYIHLLIVFVLTGLWHGSSFNFLFWGLYNGIIIIIERLVRNNKIYLSIPIILKKMLTFILIILGLVLFTCEGTMESLHYYKYLFGLAKPNFEQFTTFYYLSFYNIVFIIIGLMVSLPLIKTLSNKLIKKKQILEVLSGIFALIIFTFSIVYLVNSAYAPPLYAQF